MRRPPPLMIGLLLGIGALLLPSQALAATASVSGTTLTITPAAGENSDLRISYSAGSYLVDDLGGAVAAGAGCVRGASGGDASCMDSGITNISASLDDGLDVVNLFDATNVNPPPSAVQATLDVGSGPPLQFARGHAGPDILIGHDERDLLYGLDGDDTLIAGGGDDTLEGSGGNDYLDGGFGGDYLNGGSGADRVYGGTIFEFVLGAGNDVAQGGPGDDYVDGGFGDDQVMGDDGNDAVNGGRGDDEVSGGAGNDFQKKGKKLFDGVMGGRGDDTVDGGEGTDRISGGTGSDNLLARDGTFDRQISCGSGKDKVDFDQTPAARGGVRRRARDPQPTGCEATTKTKSGKKKDKIKGGPGGPQGPPGKGKKSAKGLK